MVNPQPPRENTGTRRPVGPSLRNLMFFESYSTLTEDMLLMFCAMKRDGGLLDSLDNWDTRERRYMDWAVAACAYIFMLMLNRARRRHCRPRQC